jgi:hypothetical protein
MKLSFCIINRCIYVEYSCSSKIRKRNWLLFPLSWTTLSHSSSLPFIDSIKCAKARISSCQPCLFLSLSVSWCQLSILDVFLFELFRSGSALLPLFSFIFIYIFIWYVFECVCPSAIANMEVSMSLVYLKENEKNKWRLFCVQNYIQNIDLNPEVIIDNCITRTMTLYLSFTQFYLLTFSAMNIQARQSNICLIISNMEKMRAREREKEQFVIVFVRWLALE